MLFKWISYLSLKLYGKEYVEDDQYLSAIATTTSAFNCIGRIAWGLICDKYSFKVAREFLFRCSFSVPFGRSPGMLGRPARFVSLHWCIGDLRHSLSHLDLSVVPDAGRQLCSDARCNSTHFWSEKYGHHLRPHILCNGASLGDSIWHRHTETKKVIACLLSIGAKQSWAVCHNQPIWYQGKMGRSLPIVCSRLRYR